MENVLSSLTTQKRLQTEEFDLFLPLDEVGRVRVGRAGPRPVHLALAEADGVDVVAADLQDEASVHHVQQAAGEDPLLVVHDVLGGGEAQLLQVDGPEQLLLVDHGAEVAVEEPAALRVADGRHGTHLLAPVQELHLQVRHWVREQDVGIGSEFFCWTYFARCCGTLSNKTLMNKWQI